MKDMLDINRQSAADQLLDMLDKRWERYPLDSGVIAPVWQEVAKEHYRVAADLLQARIGLSGLAPAMDAADSFLRRTRFLSFPEGGAV